MDANEITPLDLPGLYYTYIALNVVHILVSSALLFWRRNTFPVKGHNVYMTIFLGVATVSASLAGSVRGLLRADTCVPGTSVTYLGGTMVSNVVAAQSVRLWFEYNFAEAQLQNVGADFSSDAKQGWFYENRKHFTVNRLLAYALGVSLIEVIIAMSVAFSTGAGFGEEFPCEALLVVMMLALVFALAACAILVVIYRRLGNKRDGFGIKTGFVMICVIMLAASPVLVALDFVEGFTDLEAYVQAITETIRFVTIQLILVVALDRPVYKSLREGDHGGLSSVSQDRSREDVGGAEDVDDDNEVAAVLSNAADVVADDDIELQSSAAAAAGSVDTEGAAAPQNGSSGDKPSAAPTVFSSKTLTLSLTDILLVPLYVAQLASFTRHLVGEFNVEPLLFFFKVRAFRKHIASAAGVPLEDAALAKDAASSKDASPATTDNEISVSVRKDAPGDGDGVGESDVGVAWRALMLYFEFFADDSPSQINVGHLIYDPIHKELSEAIVDFRQLHPHTPPDDVALRRPIDTTIFDRADKNVFALLERDPFVRWRRAIRDVVDKENM